MKLLRHAAEKLRPELEASFPKPLKVEAEDMANFALVLTICGVNAQHKEHDTVFDIEWITLGYTLMVVLLTLLVQRLGGEALEMAKCRQKLWKGLEIDLREW